MLVVALLSLAFRRSTLPPHLFPHGSRPWATSSIALHLMQTRTNTNPTPLSTTRCSVVHPPHSCSQSCGLWVTLAPLGERDHVARPHERHKWVALPLTAPRKR